jgi:hypothetical protein
MSVQAKSGEWWLMRSIRTIRQAEGDALKVRVGPYSEVRSLLIDL